MVKVNIIRSRRKTISLEITDHLEVLVRAPYQVSDTYIQNFVKEKSDWITAHLEKMQKRQDQKDAADKISMEEIESLADRALKEIPARTAFFAKKIGVTYGKITIRNQRTRWGSCSSQGNLNFNCLLMLTPPEVRDYVIVHELCHRKEMNHSPRFWAEVEKVLPDYRAQKQWLKDHGGLLIARMG